MIFVEFILMLTMGLSLGWGCGQDTSKPVDKSVPQTQTSTAPNGIPKSPVSPALLVETLPTCTTDQEGWIVYLKPAEELEACESGDWVVIDMKGKDGAQGAAGKDGTSGKDGLAGAVGATGAAGTQAAPLPANIWADPVSGTYWFIGGAGNGIDTSACAGNWRSPTYGELGQAGAHGLYSGFAPLIGTNAAFDCGWSFDPTNPDGQQIGGVNIKPGATTCNAATFIGVHPKPYGMFCIHN